MISFVSWWLIFSPISISSSSMLLNIVVGIDEFYLVSVHKLENEYSTQISNFLICWRRYEIKKHCVLPLAIFAISLLVHLRTSSAAFDSYSIWIDFYLYFPFFFSENLVDTNNSVLLKRNAKIEWYFVPIFCLFFFRCYPYSLHIGCWWLCCDNLIACKTIQSIWISLRWNANNEINNNNIVFPSNLHIAKSTEQRKYFQLIWWLYHRNIMDQFIAFSNRNCKSRKNAKYQRKTVIKKTGK